MSNSLSTPWILKTVKGILDDRPETFYSNYNLNPKAVHVIGYDAKLRMLRISDTKNSFYVFLTPQCYNELTKDGTTLKDLNYCIIKLRHYHVSTVVQASGTRDQDLLKKLSYPLVINCTSIQCLGGHGLDLLNEVQDINTVISLQYGYFELCDKLLKAQFPYEQALPDSEGNFCELPYFDDANPLYEEDCQISPEDNHFISQLTGYDRRTNLILLELYRHQKQHGHQLTTSASEPSQMEKRGEEEEMASTLHESQEVLQVIAEVMDTVIVTAQDNASQQQDTEQQQQRRQQEREEELNDELIGETLQDPLLLPPLAEECHQTAANKPDEPLEVDSAATIAPPTTTITDHHTTDHYIYNYETLFEDTFSSQLYYQEDPNRYTQSSGSSGSRSNAAGAVGEHSIKSYVSSEELLGETQYDQNGGYDMVLLTNSTTTSHQSIALAGMEETSPPKLTPLAMIVEERKINVEESMELESTQVPPSIESLLATIDSDGTNAGKDTKAREEDIMLGQTQVPTPFPSQCNSPIPEKQGIIDEKEVDKLFSTISTTLPEGIASITTPASTPRVTRSRSKLTASSPGGSSVDSSMNELPSKARKPTKKLPPIPEQRAVDTEKPSDPLEELEFTQVPTQSEDIIIAAAADITPLPSTNHTIVPTNPHPDAAKHPKLPTSSSSSSSSSSSQALLKEPRTSSVPTLSNSQDSHGKGTFNKKDVLHLSGEQLLHYRIEKHFPDYGWYSGVIIAYDEPLYRVKYEDNDQEDLELVDVLNWIVAPPKPIPSVASTTISQSASILSSYSKTKPIPTTTTTAATINTTSSLASQRSTLSKPSNRNNTMSSKELRATIAELEAYQQQVSEVIDSIELQHHLRDKAGKQQQHYDDEETVQSVDAMIQDCLPTQPTMMRNNKGENKRKRVEAEVVEEEEVEDDDDDEVATVTQSPMKQSVIGTPQFFPKFDDANEQQQQQQQQEDDEEREQLTYDFCVERNINPFLLLRQHYNLETTFSILKNRYPKLLQLVRIFQERYRQENAAATASGRGRGMNQGGVGGKSPSPQRVNQHKTPNKQPLPASSSTSTSKRSHSKQSNTSSNKKVRRDSYGRLVASEGPGSPILHKTPVAFTSIIGTTSSGKKTARPHTTPLTSISYISYEVKKSESEEEEEDVKVQLLQQYGACYLSKLPPSLQRLKLDEMIKEELEIASYILPAANHKYHFDYTQYAKNYPLELGQSIPPLRRVYILAMKRIQALENNHTKKASNQQADNDGDEEEEEEADEMMIRQYYTPELAFDEEVYRMINELPDNNNNQKKKVKRRGGQHSEEHSPRLVEPHRLTKAKTKYHRLLNEYYSKQQTKKKQQQAVEEAEEECIATQPQFPPKMMLSKNTNKTTALLRSQNDESLMIEDNDMLLLDDNMTTIRSSRTDKLLLPLATSLKPSFFPFKLSDILLYTPTSMDSVQYSQYLSNLPSNQHLAVIRELVFEEQELECYYSDTRKTIDYLAYAQRYPSRATAGTAGSSQYPVLTRGFVVAMKRIEAATSLLPPHHQQLSDDVLMMMNSQETQMSTETVTTTKSSSNNKPIPKDILRIKERHIRNHYDFLMKEKPGQYSTQPVHQVIRYYTKLLHSQYELRPCATATATATAGVASASSSSVATGGEQVKKLRQPHKSPNNNNKKRSLFVVDEENANNANAEEEVEPRKKKAKKKNGNNNIDSFVATMALKGNTATVLASSSSSSSSTVAKKPTTSSTGSSASLVSITTTSSASASAANQVDHNNSMKKAIFEGKRFVTGVEQGKAIGVSSSSSALSSFFNNGGGKSSQTLQQLRK